jgi:hypothetical protein
MYYRNPIKIMCATRLNDGIFRIHWLSVSHPLDYTNQILFFDLHILQCGCRKLVAMKKPPSFKQSRLQQHMARKMYYVNFSTLHVVEFGGGRVIGYDADGLRIY